MATTATETEQTRSYAGLAPDELLDMYSTMYTARRTDDKEILLKRQNKIFFQISGVGHEAAQVALARHLRPGSDYYYLYYRDRALSLATGMTPYQHLQEAAASADDPSSGGRQMPSHWGRRDLRIVSTSSPTGTQFLQSVGCAEAGHRASMVEGMREAIDEFEDDEVVLCTGGEGQTSEGEFWEAVNTASNLKLPVVFLIEDNEYAISVPVEVGTAGGSISKLVSGFPDLYIEEYDGCDVLESYEAAGRAVEHARAGDGPALLHAHVIRPYSHSMSDDERMYKPPGQREEEAERDPVPNFREFLIQEGIAGEDELEELEQQIDDGIQQATDRVLEEEQPAPETATRYLYSPDVDPTSDEFDTEDSPEYEGDETTMVDLLNACMRDEMERDARVVTFGEDVADASREEVLEEVKGKGGVFKVTAGLQRQFGRERVFNSPLAEANIVGRAIGMATRGLRPVAEIQFMDYIWPAFMQIRNELPTMRYRSNNSWNCPVVVRTTYGGYIHGAIYHSQTGETLFTHTPGLRVVMPATAEDANGLLRAAIRCDDPVIFLEHKHLYRQVYNKGRDPGPDYMIPFGKARVAREGTDLTVVTCGALVKRSLDAAKEAEKRSGISTEVIDLRTLNPLDMETVAESVKKTNKVVVAYEDALSWGVGSEISARIADEVFEWLDGPVRRVASLDTWVAYAPRLEEAILPDADDVLEVIEELAAY